MKEKKLKKAGKIETGRVGRTRCKQNKNETEHRVPYASRRTAVVEEGEYLGRGTRSTRHKAASVVHAQPPGRAHLLCVLTTLLVGRRRSGRSPRNYCVFGFRGRITISILNSPYFETFVFRSNFKLGEGGRERERLSFCEYHVIRARSRRYSRRCSDCVDRKVVCHHSEMHHHRSSTTHKKGMDYFEILLEKKDLFGMLSIAFALRLRLVMYMCYCRGINWVICALWVYLYCIMSIEVNCVTNQDGNNNYQSYYYYIIFSTPFFLRYRTANITQYIITDQSSRFSCDCSFRKLRDFCLIYSFRNTNIRE